MPPSSPDDSAPPPPPTAEEVEALRWSERRLRALVDFTTRIFWTCDASGRARDSASWREFTGRGAVFSTRSEWMETLHPEDRALVDETWDASMAASTPFELRYRLRRADGQYVWMLARAVPLRDDTGAVHEWVGTLTDIHAQRVAEERSAFLARAGELLASSLDFVATLGVLTQLAVPKLADWCVVDMLGLEGRFERVQVVTAQPSEAALAEVVRGLPPLPKAQPVYPPTVALLLGRSSLVEEVTDAVMMQVAQSELHLTTMRRLGIRSLITVPLLARGRILGAFTLLHTGSGRRFGSEDLRFAQELAHRAALSMDNARLYRKAQEAIRLRDEFLSIASHELKTPLTPLSLKLQALERAAEATPDSPLAGMVRSHVEAGRQQMRKLTELMNDLLDVSRINAGTFRMQREDMDLALLVREVGAVFAPRAARVESTLTVHAGQPVRGHWDRLRLEQVVTHLVDNALKYGAGKPVLIILTTQGAWARLMVRDRGIGIEPAHKGRIFERYARAVSERHYGGLGLGLYITRTIVEAEGGQVSVDSEPGQGSTFVVELPLPPE